MKNILVPIDGSEFSLRALPYAAKLGRLTKVPLMLLQAIPKPVPVPAGRQPIRELLEQEVGRLKAMDLKAESSTPQGEPAQVILSASEEAQLIVMTSHGWSGIGQWLLGSVVQKVVRAAACPVLVIRGPALQESTVRPWKKVLVPLDGSELSLKSLPYAHRWAQHEGGQLLLFRTLVTDAGHDLPSMHAAHEEEKKMVGEYLAGVAAGIADVPARGVTKSGTPVSTILKVAKEQEVDLIVMTTHGRGGIERWVCGSVAEGVVQRAECPVLIVRPSKD